MFKTTRALFWGMAIPALFFAMFADSPQKTLAWVGYGIIFALLALVSAVAAKDEK